MGTNFPNYEAYFDEVVEKRESRRNQPMEGEERNLVSSKS